MIVKAGGEAAHDAAALFELAQQHATANGADGTAIESATRPRRKCRQNPKLVWVRSVADGLSAACLSNILLINVLCHS